MVHRDLLEAVVAHPIKARIADVRYRHAVVVKQARDERRAHALALRLGLSRLVDDLVGTMDRISEHDRLTHVARAGLDVGAIFALAGFAH